MTSDAPDTAWTSVRLKAGVFEGLGLPDIPLPVRKGQLADLFGDGRVRFEHVLEEVDLYVTAHPEAAPVYRDTLVSLAHALAIHHGAEGRPAEAVRLLRLGLRHAPGSHRLQANLALGLHLSGETDEAVRHYRRLLEADGESAFPLLRVLAAKACEETGAVKDARDILREGRALMAGDTPYEGLLQDLESRVEEEAPAPPAPSRKSRSKPRARPGARSQAESGASTAATSTEKPEASARPTPRESAPKFCRACGAKLKPGKRFCAACGGETGVAR